VDVRTFKAPEGERLDVAMAQALELSRTHAKDLVDDGFVTIDGQPVGKPATKLRGQETVSVILPPTKPMRVVPESIPLEILYQDDSLIAVNKPAGIIAHPTATVRTGTVVNALLGRFDLSKERLFDPTESDYRPGIVHRLDRHTSGVMVVAKTNSAHKHLSASFRKRLTEKEYIAVTVGTFENDIDIDAPIGRHPIRRQTMTVGGSNPKSASTAFRIVAKTQNFTLIRAKPHSGRTHQIRVHLQHLGTPILGDDVYGKSSTVIIRQALHAHKLSLPHPKDNLAITFVAEPPSDIIQAWIKLGGNWPPKLLGEVSGLTSEDIQPE
tara:strand:+ start:24102 stop:25073 length:972 start_codon:yes stop_codon:yes gene_type:complete